MSYFNQNRFFAVIDGEEKDITINEDKTYTLEGEPVKIGNYTNKYGYFVSLVWKELELVLFVNGKGQVYFTTV
jgi:hypothetical protein